MYRAQILILLDQYGPTTRAHIHSFGYKKKFVSRVFRDLITEDLAAEKCNLYRVTPKGNSVVDQLSKIPIVLKWMDEDPEDLHLRRPTITKL